MNKTYIDLALVILEKDSTIGEKRLDSSVRLRLQENLTNISHMLDSVSIVKSSSKNEVEALQKYLYYFIEASKPKCSYNLTSHIAPLEEMLDTIGHKGFNYEDMKSSVLDLNLDTLLEANKDFLFEFEPVTLHYLTSTMRTLDGLYLESKLRNQPFNCFMLWDKKEDSYTLYNTEQEVNDFIKKELTKEYTGVDKTIFANRFYATHYADTETLEMSGMSLMLLESLGYEKTFRELGYLTVGKPNPFEYMLYMAEYTTNVQLELHVSVELEKKPFKG